MMPYLAVYIVGVLIGLAVMRDAWHARLATALVWPLGPIAFVVVLAILLTAAAVLWPAVMLAAAVAVAFVLWLI